MATAIGSWQDTAKQSPPTNKYVAWAAVSLITALTVALYAATLADLANDWWTDPSLSQGLLIPPLAIWIAWMRRDLTLAHPVMPGNRGLLMVAGACLIFLFGRFGAEFFLSRISFVLLLAGLIWTFWGIERLRTLVFPILLLATMVPLPVTVYNSLAAPLQLFASDIATRLVQLFGISVYADGNVINLAHVSLNVERACSGLNSLSALMVGAILLGFLQCRRSSARILLFLLSIPLSIAVNVFRVAGTAFIADYHEELALGFYHSFTGWMVFIVGFAALYGMAKAIHFVIDPKEVIP
jgi:exosortase